MTSMTPCRNASALLAVLGLALAPCVAGAWSLPAHQRVTTEAIDLLPKRMKGFFKDHRFEIATLAVDAVDEDEGPERRFAADLLTPFPFFDLPRNEEMLQKKWPEQAADMGRLPWLIQEAHGALEAAFRVGDRALILQSADRLSLLVADLHNPLALTKNSDGQDTGQHGLWVRLTQRLPEALAERIEADGDAAHYLDHPEEHVFSMMNASYIWLDNLLYHEELAARGHGGYTELYYADLALRLRPMLKVWLSDAATDVSSFWYTAWTDAGRPELE
jgi:hypothetical protein